MSAAVFDTKSFFLLNIGNSLDWLIIIRRSALKKLINFRAQKPVCLGIEELEHIQVQESSKFAARQKLRLPRIYARMLLGLFLIAFGLSHLLTTANAQVVIAPNVLRYGDEDLCNQGSYPSDPKAGATLLGLAPNAITSGATPVAHNYPISPQIGDYPGMDRIFVGSNQTAAHDGYSQTSSRTAGPQIMTFNYSSLVTPGTVAASLTLGIAADDFQSPFFNQPFSARINNVVFPQLSAYLNQINLSNGRPLTGFFTIGVPTTLLNSDSILSLSIDCGGDGGDGWAIDFVTIGATPVPEPSSLLFVAGSALLAGIARWKRRIVMD